MKPNSKIMMSVLSCFFAIFMALSAAPQSAKAQPGNNIYSYQVFYNDLAPYGQWLNDPQYGYVWLPDAGPNFRPYYTNGYWVMTAYGNMWVSNYAWGWAPFHYGRWVLSDFYGWIWIPGSEWGPAWVNWRQGNGYYGWAPMGPGVSINISFGPNYYLPDPYWTFIPCRYIYARSFHRYYAPKRTPTLIRHTTIINNTYIDRSTRVTYVAGPRRSDVQRHTGRPVPVYNVAPRRSAGSASVQGKVVNIYRPRVENNTRNIAPRNVKTVRQPITDPARTNATLNNRASRNLTPVKSAPARQQAVERNNSRQKIKAAPVRQTSPARPQQSSQPARHATPVQRQQPVRATPTRQVQPQRTQAPVRQARPAQQPARSIHVSPKPEHPVERAVPNRDQRSAPVERRR